MSWNIATLFIAFPLSYHHNFWRVWSAWTISLAIGPLLLYSRFVLCIYTLVDSIVQIQTTEAMLISRPTSRCMTQYGMAAFVNDHLSFLLCTCSRRIKNTYYCFYPIKLTRNGLNVKFKSSLQPLPLRALLWWPLYVHEANEPAIADEYRISRSIIMVLPIRAIDRSWRRLWSIYNHLKVSSYPYRLCNITRIAKRVNRCRTLARRR